MVVRDSAPLTASAAALRELMASVGIGSWQELSQRTGVSRRAIQRLRAGEIDRLRVRDLLALCRVLSVDANTLIRRLADPAASWEAAHAEDAIAQGQHLTPRLALQEADLRADFIRAAVAQLEPLLLQWPTAQYAAQQNPHLPAKNVMPLIRPLWELLQRWGVTPIGSVGERVSYDPRWHELTGNADLEVRAPAIVRYVGYRWGDILLYRARVEREEA